VINALSYHLFNVKWQLVCTLTFGANWNAKKTRNKVDRVFGWLRRIYGFHSGSVVLDGQPFVVSEERGEMRDRYHVHMLIAGLPEQPSRADCFAMQWLWKDGFKGGFAKIRPYNPSLSGVRYTMKSLDLSDLRAISSESGREKARAISGCHIGHTTSFAGANAFEVGKIGDQSSRDLMVMVSRGCIVLCAGIASPSVRRLERSKRFYQLRRKELAPGTKSKKHKVSA